MEQTTKKTNRKREIDASLPTELDEVSPGDRTGGASSSDHSLWCGGNRGFYRVRVRETDSGNTDLVGAKKIAPDSRCDDVAIEKTQ